MNTKQPLLVGFCQKDMSSFDPNEISQASL
jgi:hypothetical protein